MKHRRLAPLWLLLMGLVLGATLYFVYLALGFAG